MAPKLDGAALISALKQLDFQVTKWLYLRPGINKIKVYGQFYDMTYSGKWSTTGPCFLQSNYGRVEMCGGYVLFLYRPEHLCIILL